MPACLLLVALFPMLQLFHFAQMWCPVLTLLPCLLLQARDHLDFVCKLKEYADDRQQLLDRIPASLQKAGFTIEPADLHQAESFLDHNYFKNTKVVDLVSSKQVVVDPSPSHGSIAPGQERT